MRVVTQSLARDLRSTIPSFQWWVSLMLFLMFEKYPTFFCENLMDFNEARLHEAILNLHTHTWILSCLSIASVDGKQHLSEVVLSALVGFSLEGKWRNDWNSALDSDSFDEKPDSCGSSGSLLSWYQEVLPKQSESSALLHSFRNFPYNGNLTWALNTTSLKCWLPSTEAVDRRKNWKSRPESALHWNPSSFRKKEIGRIVF